NPSPNIGRPLFDCSCVASSSITSQCSARSPSLMRTMSAAIQFTGWPKPEKRPCTITKSFSATISRDSYFRVGGMLLISLNRPFATRFDVSAVLNVVGRPVAFGRCIVPLIEECVEGLKDKRFVLLFDRLIHFLPFLPN